MKYDRDSELWKRIHDEACRTRVIDCHSHLIGWDEYEQQERRPGLFDLLGYFGGDMRDMGAMGLKGFGEADTDEDRWGVLKEALRRGANTSYYRHSWHTLCELFGLDGAELDDNNWRGIHERIQEESREPGRYRRLLKDIAGIDLSIHNTFLVDSPSGCVPGLAFPRVPKDGYRAGSVGVVDLIMLFNTDPLHTLAKEANVEIKDAASVSGLLITTEAAVSELPEDKPAMPMGGGGMGGMGGMDF